jgi:hypothetical protein
MPDHAAAPRPDCANECEAVLREMYAAECAKLGFPVPDYHVSHLPPLVESGYVDLQMVCPHGVTWHMEPTSDQIAEWARDGVA